MAWFPFGWDFFPSTNFDKVNLDWIFTQLREIKSKEDEVTAAATEAREAAEEATTAAREALEVVDDAAAAVAEVTELAEQAATDAAAAVETANHADDVAGGLAQAVEDAEAAAQQAEAEAAAATEAAAAVVDTANAATATANAAAATANAAALGVATVEANLALLAGMVNFSTYSSVEELSLTTPALATLWAAMASPSMACVPAVELLTSELPEEHGVAVLYKNDNGGFVSFHSATGHIYQRTMDGQHLGGAWIRCVIPTDLHNLEIERTVVISGESTQTTYNLEAPIPPVEGYTPAGIAGYNSSGMTYLTVTNLYVSGQMVRMSGRNTGSGAVTPNFNVYVRYVKDFT